VSIIWERMETKFLRGDLLSRRTRRFDIRRGKKSPLYLRGKISPEKKILGRGKKARAA